MKRKKLWILLAVMMGATLTGCSKGEQDEPLVVVEQEKEETAYKTAIVTRDDVILTKNERCIYKQTKDNPLSFSVSGKRVEKVFVKKGDAVKKGDLLAQLSGDNLDQDIERLEYNIKRNEILQKHAEENEALDISQRWVNAIYHYAKDNVEEDVANIQKNYRYMKEDYADALEIDRMELDKLKAEKNASFLYAGMDGIVYSMEDYLEGSTSEKDKVVMTIIDNSECLFTTSNPDNVQYYKEGMLIPMTITSSSAAGEYQITPWHMDEWDEEQYFSVVSGPDGSSIEVGTNGYMKVVMASKEQVLSIPKEALNYAGDKYYVYVIGENNMREVQWVEIGVYGDTRVEIINGLSEGDKVISR